MDTLSEDVEPTDTSAVEYHDPPSPPTCQGLCYFLGKNCNGDQQQFEDKESCLKWCNDTASLPIGQDTDTEENSVGCRTLHAFQASDPTIAKASCTSGGPTGGGQCGSWCENYCFLSEKICPASFTDPEACAAACDDDPECIACKMPSRFDRTQTVSL